MNLMVPGVFGALSLVLGWYLGAAYSNASALPLDQSFAMYDYKNSSCTTMNDPITVVFINGNGFPNHVRQHSGRGDHGGWSHDLVDYAFGKYFYDNYGCSSQDDQAASQAGAGHNQYHMRWEVTATDNAGQAYAATPHYEIWSWTQWTHCVDNAAPGGYVKGKDDIKKNWRDIGNEHPNFYWSFWNNVAQMTQDCGYSVGSDGWVMYLDMVGNDVY